MPRAKVARQQQVFPKSEPGSFRAPFTLSAWSRAEKLTTSRWFSVVPAGTSVAPANDGGGRSLRSLQQQGRELVGHVEHHIMAACKLLLPPAALSCLGVKLAERTVMATRQNVSDGWHAV